jgi:serine/threonine protein kinase
MEYLDGGNINVLLNEKVAWNEKYLALFDISEAIINCRSIVPGFAHLDIKPENCLRTKFGLTKLSDFGLSCYVNTDLKTLFPKKQNFDTSLSLPLRTKNGIRCAGTPLYMAPEQILGSVREAQKSDVYSFGILALEILSGEHPLIGLESLEDIFDAHIRGIHRERRQWPRHINSLLIDTLDRTLNPDPNGRPSIEEINEQLKLAYDGPRLMVASGLEKLADAFEDASRKAKSLWVLGQREAAVSILKNNLQTDPSQADL